MAELSAPTVQVVRCDNPSAMTLEGTNTYLVTYGAAAYVVDPGPDPRLWPDHLREIESRLEGAQLAGVVLTHGHPDHADAAPSLAQRHAAPVWCADPAVLPGALPLAEGDVLSLGGAAVMRTMLTPGHTRDSLCLLLGDGTLLTGDTVLGRGPTVVLHPDGRLGDYLATLDRLVALVADGGVSALRPGHGDVIETPGVALGWLREHRMTRLRAVRQAVTDNPGAWGEELVEAILQAVYADAPAGLQAASRASIRAQLQYLREQPAAGSV